jgi:regulator of nonsense transcripts 1
MDFLEIRDYVEHFKKLLYEEKKKASYKEFQGFIGKCQKSKPLWRSKHSENPDVEISLSQLGLQRQSSATQQLSKMFQLTFERSEPITCRIEEGPSASKTFYLTLTEKVEFKEGEPKRSYLLLRGAEIKTFEEKSTENQSAASFSQELLSWPSGTTYRVTIQIKQNLHSWYRMMHALKMCIDDTTEQMKHLNKLLLNPAKFLNYPKSSLLGKQYFECLPIYSEHGLNPRQEEILRKVLFPDTRDRKIAVTLVRGPPGSGKTKLAEAIILEWILRFKFTLSVTGKLVITSPKILICAPSNLMVEQLLQRIISAQKTILKKNNLSKQLLALTEKVRIVKLQSRTREDQTEKNEVKKEEDLSQYFVENIVAKALREKDVTQMYDRNSLMRNVIHEANIICCTLNCASDERISLENFSHLLIDEATQSTEPETLIALSKHIRNVVIMGDEFQLGPVVQSAEAERDGLGRSLFQRLVEKAPSVALTLNIQYRMQRNLIAYSNHCFYNNKLQSDPQWKPELALPICFPNSLVPMVCVDLPYNKTFDYQDFQKRKATKSNSFWRKYEVEEIVGLLGWLKKISEISANKIGIITFYSAQKALLDKRVHDCFQGFEPTIGTVDSFQGQEKDIIIISCVRTSNHLSTDTSVGFLDCSQRLNTAITRCKQALFIFGDFTTLTAKSTVWSL